MLIPISGLLKPTCRKPMQQQAFNDYLKASPMPPAPFTLACCELDLFFEFSAEICAGSLVSG